MVSKIQQILELRWKAAASMDVTRVVENKDNFKVTKKYNLHGKGEDKKEGSNTLDVGETKTNLLNPKNGVTPVENGRSSSTHADMPLATIVASFNIIFDKFWMRITITIESSHFITFTATMIIIIT